MAEQDDTKAACLHRVLTTGSCWVLRCEHGPGLDGALKGANVDFQCGFCINLPNDRTEKYPKEFEVGSCKPLKKTSANQGKN